MHDPAIIVDVVAPLAAVLPAMLVGMLKPAVEQEVCCLAKGTQAAAIEAVFQQHRLRTGPIDYLALVVLHGDRSRQCVRIHFAFLQRLYISRSSHVRGVRSLQISMSR